MYTDTALVELLLLFNYDVIKVVSNNANTVITFALYLLGVPVLFIHNAVMKLILSYDVASGSEITPCNKID